MIIQFSLGKDNRYRLSLHDDEGNWMMGSLKPYDTPGEAAAAGKAMAFALREQGIKGIYTEAGQRWIT